MDKVARTANSKVDKLEGELEGSRGEVAAFRAGTKEVKENYSAALDTLQQSVTTLTAQHDSLRTELHKCREQLKGREEELEEVKKQIAQKEEEKKKLEHENLVLKSKLEGICLSLEHQAGQGGGGLASSTKRMLASLGPGEGQGQEGPRTSI